MMKNPGYIVITKDGHTGRTRHADHRVNGKIVVYLEKDGKPILDEKLQQKKLLCEAAKLQIKGYVD